MGRRDEETKSWGVKVLLSLQYIDGDRAITGSHQPFDLQLLQLGCFAEHHDSKSTSYYCP